MLFVYRHLFQLLWFCWIFYWIASASGVKRTAQHESVLSRIIHGTPLWIAIILISAPDLGRHGPFAPIWPFSPAVFWLGALVTLAGFAITVWARVTLGRNWSGWVTIKENHELIQTGPYAWVRHPIYTGLILAFLGSALARDQWRGAVAVVLVVIAFRIKLGIEEAWMMRQFGPNYAAYKKRTKMLVPYIW